MTADFAAARSNMVESQVRPSDVTDHAIQDAMRRVPRETLVPADKAFLAYADAEAEYAPGRWLLSPRDVGKLLQAVRPRPGEQALAVAAPYAALLLRDMGLEVTEVDAADPTPAGPFDVVVVEGAVAAPRPEWTAALGLGGRLGVVQRDGPVGRAMLYLRAPDGVGSRPLFDSTPSYLAGFEPAHGFSF
ncbi:MAG: protein-L-isoaspartate O-methyltransferase [Caulobacterales bacterium]